MSAAPPGVPWLDSNGIKALIKAMVIAALVWAGNSIAPGGSWDFRQLGAAEIPILITGVIVCFAPGVQGPFAFMNKSNPP